MNSGKDNKNTKKKLFSYFMRKYRFEIMRNQTLEQRKTFVYNRLQVSVVIMFTALLIIILTSLIFIYSPVKYYLPGVGSQNNQETYDLSIRTDSLKHQLEIQNKYIENVRIILNGGEIIDDFSNTDTNRINIDTITDYHSPEDSILRAEIESYGNTTNNLNSSSATNTQNALIEDFFFFPPIKGIIINNYNPIDKHYGIDIAAKDNETVKTTLDGIVLFSDWTIDGGYCIIIQHSNNLLSVYKHNSSLLKKQGDYVKAGNIISIVGDSGEESTGPHLHFELWFNGNHINPRKYINFE